jgi:hypothetical protein
MEKLNFGFWFRDGKFGLNECNKCENILLKENIKFKRKNYAIEFEEVFESNDLKEIRKKEIKDIMLSNKITRYVILDGVKEC